MRIKRSPRSAVGRIAAIVAAVVLAGAPFAIAAGDDATEDILYMNDGRELHGQILSQTDQFVVFEMKIGTITSTVTIQLEDVARVKHDVPIAVEPETPSRPGLKRTPSTTSRPDRITQRTSRFGSRGDGLDVPGLYIVPMKGQLGTDIHPSIYEEVVEDIQATQPDLIVLEMDCKDVDDLLIPLNEATEQGLFMHHEYRKIVDLFRDDLRDIPQVMWVADSVGFSSLLAMAWDKLYMTREARLGGLRRVSQRAEGWSDPDVAAKMMAAWTGIGRGFLENGGYSHELAEAMMRPKHTLSASFKGREVVWLLNDHGEFLVDNDDERTLNFRSKIAEDLLVSQGTADSLDDLAFLLGYREYRVLDAAGKPMVEDYKEKWRAAFEKTEDLFRDYQDSLNFAQGDETLQYLSRAKSNLEKILRFMDKYEAVEIRWRTDHNTSRLQIQVTIESLREQIRALRQGRRGGGRGIGGGGRGIGRGGG